VKSPAFDSISPLVKFFLPVLLTLGIANCTPVAAGNADQEQRNARAAARLIEAEWPVRAANDPVSRYVQVLGEGLGGAAAEGRSVPWSFTVLRDRTPYAFSIGAGHIYLAEGAVSFVRNEAELAAILAHEIGHQLAGDPGTPAADSRDRALQGGSAPPRRQKVGSLTQIYDLEKEKEADRWAIFLLQKKGFDPHALVDVLQRLPPSGSYHYYNDERRTRALQQELAGRPRISRQESDEFKTVRNVVQNEQKQ
jgi:predicted Zn-dependent protease